MIVTDFGECFTVYVANTHGSSKFPIKHQLRQTLRYNLSRDHRLHPRRHLLYLRVKGHDSHHVTELGGIILDSGWVETKKI